MRPSLLLAVVVLVAVAAVFALMGYAGIGGDVRRDHGPGSHHGHTSGHDHAGRVRSHRQDDNDRRHRTHHSTVRTHHLDDRTHDLDDDPVTSWSAAVVEAQLGRPARGMVGVAVTCPFGFPAVVETSPYLEDGEPFPTLLYLTCPSAVQAVSREEAAGGVASLRRLVTGLAGAAGRPRGTRGPLSAAPFTAGDGCADRRGSRPGDRHRRSPSRRGQLPSRLHGGASGRDRRLVRSRGDAT